MTDKLNYRYENYEKDGLNVRCIKYYYVRIESTGSRLDYTTTDLDTINLITIYHELIKKVNEKIEELKRNSLYDSPEERGYLDKMNPLSDLRIKYGNLLLELN